MILSYLCVRGVTYRSLRAVISAKDTGALLQIVWAPSVRCDERGAPSNVGFRSQRKLRFPRLLSDALYFNAIVYDRCGFTSPSHIFVHGSVR